VELAMVYQSNSARTITVAELGLSNQMTGARPASDETNDLPVQVFEQVKWTNIVN